jgi:hypothetical protein
LAERRIDEAVRLLKTLIYDREVYFDRTGHLNSEGMKIIARVARIVAEELPEHLKIVKEARSRKSYESVLNLLERLSEQYARSRNPDS